MRFDTQRKIGMRAARLACVAGLSITLAAGGALAVAPSPAAAATAQTTSELSRLQAEVEAAASTYNSATAKADELNAQVDQIASEILTIEQEKLPAYQKKAAAAASNLYKMKTGSSSTLSALLDSDSFADFITMSKYLNTIQKDNVDALNELDKVEEELNDKLSELSAAKDQALAEQQKASEALAAAKSSAAKIQQQADAENAAEAAAAAAAAQKAAELEAAQAAKQQTSSNSQASGSAQQDSSAQSGSGSSSSNAGSSTSGSISDSAGSGSSSSTSDQSGWKSGKASYYGIGDGFMGGTTASGEIVTETSMGVAMLNVPLGTRVEISYKGKSVIAVVNDRGPYAKDRVIDMQPAVARALGFLSVGVDTVSYRFL